MQTWQFTSVVVGLGLALGACQERADAPLGDGPPLASTTSPIVNGTTETGWPGVGALTVTYPFGGYSGSFCTGTLIASRWVLTAGHCLAADENGDAFSPSMVKFLVGNNANPNNQNVPTNGTLYQSDAFYIHPQYDPDTLDNDVALLHLASAVPSPTTYPVNTSFLNATGQDAFYVGFGATNGITETGSGVKRSTSIEISWVYNDQFTADYVTTGTCFGDSGGPVFLQFGGVWRIIGVNSAIAVCNPNTDPSCDPDPCKRSSIATRADVYAGWIAGITNGPAPSCTANPSMCACAGACLANGSCNNALCQVADCETTYDCLVSCADDAACQVGCYNAATAQAQAELDAIFVCAGNNCDSVPEADYGTCMQQSCGPQLTACFPVGTGPASCREVYDCLVECTTDACATDCYETGTSQAQGELDDLLGCLDTNCGTLTGTAYQTCAGENCGAEIDTCFPTRTGDATCEEVADCIAACADADEGCPFACFETGTSAAQDAYDAIADCANTECGTLSGAAFSECLTTECATEYDACFVPANCAITGGECPSGEACFPTITGATDCFASNGKALGVTCDPDAANLDCGDGAICMEGTPNTCAAFCRSEVDCGPGRACKALDLGVDGLGTCGCEDFDADGACADDDCDDAAAAVKPGAVEACGDGIDNNCVGGVDEGCATCTDGDDDGYCTPADCDDADATANPGAAEKCGDGKDNDCEGGTDEGCATCTDGDDDGYCADVDCFDDDGASHPGADDVCGDGKDNDCSGLADDGCNEPVEPGPEPGPETTTGSDATSGGDATTGTSTSGGDTVVQSVGKSASGCAGAGGGAAWAVGAALVLLAGLRRRRSA